MKKKPVVILVEPQLGENIGAVARAMLNCDLEELRIVRPRDGWPNELALRTSVGASSIIQKARVFTDTKKAIADLQHVFACTARSRDVQKPIVNEEEGSKLLSNYYFVGESCGTLFGGERSGLSNEEISYADTVLTIQVNPSFSSLNLAQAVLIVSYNWYISLRSSCQKNETLKTPKRATKKEIFQLFQHLEKELYLGGFLDPPEKAPSVLNSLRAIIQRADLSERETKMLRGVISSIKRAGRI